MAAENAASAASAPDKRKQLLMLMGMRCYPQEATEKHYSVRCSRFAGYAHTRGSKEGSFSRNLRHDPAERDRALIHVYTRRFSQALPAVSFRKCLDAAREPVTLSGFLRLRSGQALRLGRSPALRMTLLKSNRVLKCLTPQRVFPQALKSRPDTKLYARPTARRAG